jgi:hypothetical protein
VTNAHAIAIYWLDVKACKLAVAAIAGAALALHCTTVVDLRTSLGVMVKRWSLVVVFPLEHDAGHIACCMYTQHDWPTRLH